MPKLYDQYVKEGDRWLYRFRDHQSLDVEIELNLIYTDKAGERYYDFKYVNQMSTERTLATVVAEEGFAWNITPADLAAKMDQIILNIRSNPSEVISIATDIRHRVVRLCDYDNTLELAGIYFLCEQEHPGRYSAHWKTEKIARWKKDDDARSFFLTRCLEKLKPYAELSAQDLLNYLETEGKGVKSLKPDNQITPSRSEKLSETGNMKTGSSAIKTPVRQGN